MPDKSTPNPSEQDPNQLPKEQERPRLKLKRLVVKDTKINPHVKPDAEPVPQAEAYVEPEPPPVQKEPDLPPSVQQPVQSPVQEEPNPAVKEDFEEQPEQEVEPQAQEQPKPKLNLDKSEASATAKSQTVSQAKEADTKKAAPVREKKRRRKSTIIFPLILIIGSLLYGTHLVFDPLGLKPKPIVPRDIPHHAAEQAVNQTGTEEVVSQVASTANIQQGSIDEIQAYVDQVAKLPIEVSSNPDGVFIGSVYYSVGMPINPSLGLVVDSIFSEEGNQLILLKDSDGLTYTLPVH